MNSYIYKQTARKKKAVRIILTEEALLLFTISSHSEAISKAIEERSQIGVLIEGKR